MKRSLICCLSRACCDHKYFNVVGIFGVEGVGKTRLAREICDKLEGEEETFKPKIWFSSSELLTSVEESRKLTLVKHILTNLGAEQRKVKEFIEELQQQQQNKMKQEETPNNADPKPGRGILRTSKLGDNKSKQPQQEKEEKKEQDQPETSTARKPDPAKQPQAIPSTLTKRSTKADKRKQEETGKKADPDDPILGGLLGALHRKLTGKKYLIVLDAVFNSFDDPWFGILGSRFEKGATAIHKWEDRPGFGFPKGDGGAVIVTGRSKKAVKNMVGEENCYRHLPLKDIESCWQIYKEATEEDGIQIQEDGDLKQLGIQKM
ncbi:hypothetical protein Ancab_014923 [Ancistrocladus abbreviatus]